MDAQRIADILGLPVHDSELVELTKALGTLYNLLGSDARVREWLYRPAPFLEGKPPIELYEHGGAKALANYVYRGVAGEPA